MLRYGQNGLRHETRPITESVGRAIETLPLEKEFTLGDLVGLPYLRRHMKGILKEKAVQGVLVRVRRGVYKRVASTKFTRFLPMGEVANATWATLISDRGRLWLCREVAEEVSEIINRRGYDCRNHVGKTLYIWHKLGYLTREGDWKTGYKYQPKENVVERPPLRKKY